MQPSFKKGFRERADLSMSQKTGKKPAEHLPYRDLTGNTQKPALSQRVQNSDLPEKFLIFAKICHSIRTKNRQNDP
jgi:hypothetical protein